MLVLSKRAEKVLQEILEHRLENGNCDVSYWKGRFNELSAAEDVMLRSVFRELREAEMISVSWADNYPYTLFLLAKGASYFDELNRNETPAYSSYVNNFFGTASNVQIQQGNENSYQMMSVCDDNTELYSQFIANIRKYDAILETEFGSQTNELREKLNELENIVNDNNSSEKRRNIVEFIRNMAANATGGLIAAGIVELATKILG